jgi:hypothetical protein
MTEVFLSVPPLPFPTVQQQAGSSQSQAQQGDGVCNPPRCAIHGNETFIPIGTPLADLDILFPK